MDEQQRQMERKRLAPLQEHEDAPRWKRVKLQHKSAGDCVPINLTTPPTLTAPPTLIAPPALPAPPALTTAADSTNKSGTKPCSDKCTKNIVSLADTKARLQREREAHDKALADVRRRLESAEKKNACLAGEIKERETRSAHREQSFIEAQKEMQLSRDKNDDLVRQLEDVKRENGILRGAAACELEAKDREIEHLERSMEREMKWRDGEERELKAAGRSLEAELQRFEQEAEARVEEMVQMRTREAFQGREQCRLQMVVAQKKAQALTLAISHKSLECDAKLERAERRCEELERGCEVLESINSNFVSTHHSIVAECESGNAEKSRTIEERDATIAEAHAHIQHQNATIAEAEKAVQQKDAIIEEARKAVQEKDALIAETEQKVQHNKQIMEQQGIAIETAQREYETITTNIKKAIQTVRKLQLEIGECKDEILARNPAGGRALIPIVCLKATANHATRVLTGEREQATAHWTALRDASLAWESEWGPSIKPLAEDFRSASRDHAGEHSPQNWSQEESQANVDDLAAALSQSVQLGESKRPRGAGWNPSNHLVFGMAGVDVLESTEI
jgi:hypothetical protein